MIRKADSRSSLARVAGIRLQGTTVAKVIDRLAAGLPFSSVETLGRQMKLSVDDVGELTRIPQRTLARRKSQGVFTQEESERLYRLASVFERALGLFDGNRDAAIRWLQTPRKVFDGKSALEFAQSELGAREVEDVIERIEYGVIQ